MTDIPRPNADLLALIEKEELASPEEIRCLKLNPNPKYVHDTCMRIVGRCSRHLFWGAVETWAIRIFIMVIAATLAAALFGCAKAPIAPPQAPACEPLPSCSESTSRDRRVLSDGSYLWCVPTPDGWRWEHVGSTGL